MVFVVNDIEKTNKSPLRKFCLGYNKTNLYLVNYAMTRLHFTVESACQPQEGAIAAQPIRRYIGQQRNISFLAVYVL